MNDNTSKLLARRAAVLTLLTTAVALPMAAQAITSEELPEPKRSKLGLYLQAKDVPAFIEAHGGSGKVLFEHKPATQALCAARSPIPISSPKRTRFTSSRSRPTARRRRSPRRA